jgi:4-aminobutyrate aminotransferase-like enzyme
LKVRFLPRSPLLFKHFDRFLKNPPASKSVAVAVLVAEQLIVTSHRGGQPSKLRLSTPYYLSKADLDRFLAAFDQFLKLKGVA